MIEALLSIALCLSAATAVATSLGAHFAADYFKRNKIVQKSAPDFIRSGPPPFFLETGISLGDIFSETHKAYGNKFISRCVYIARASIIAIGALSIALVMVVVI
ncbi:MAG: hypothetical protein ACK4OJ_10580 [Brevundimonas sp.]